MYAYETADDIGATKTQASGGLMPVVIAGGVLTLIGTALGLGLGVGLHTDDKSLIYVTTTVATSRGTQCCLPPVATSRSFPRALIAEM